MAASKWRDVVDKAVRINRTRSIRQEWKKYTPDKVIFLQELADPDTPFSSLVDKYNLIQLLGNDEGLVLQCIQLCLEKSSEVKFWPLFEFLETTILENQLILEHDSDIPTTIKQLYQLVLSRIIENEDVLTLEDLLTYLNEPSRIGNSSYTSIMYSLAKNSPVLMAACRKDHFGMVKVLVASGYRLHTRHRRTKVSCWSRYTQMPSVIMAQNISSLELQKSSLFEGGDEVNDLHILRLMAKASYIIACYEDVVDKSLMAANDDHDNIAGCDCISKLEASESSPGLYENVQQLKTNKRAGAAGIWMTRLKYEVEPEPFHYCPANVNFKPNLDCRQHVECNDPISRCFDLAKMASEYADSIPEYRAEYEEIAGQCRKLSVQLLDQCIDTQEVQTLLAESAGSSKYFRYSSTMKYPRLRLAIEHNHKEFVGHMFCQQTLRQEWHGGIAWQGRPVTYKLLHFVLQVLLAPIFVSILLITDMGRDLKDLWNVNIPTVEMVKAAKMPKKAMLWFIYQSNHVKLNLDVPLNRFLVFTGYYVIFVGLVLKTTLANEETSTFEDVRFEFYHYILSIYSISMLWQDFLTLITLRSYKAYFKFWRVYDLLLHITLFLALLFRLLQVQNFSFRLHLGICDDKTSSECIQFLDTRKTLFEYEGVFWAFASTQALMRLIYWVQLHEKVGPVVINMSRVIVDIFSIAGSYLLIALSFSTGLVFILTTEHYRNNYAALNSAGAKTNYTAYAESFSKMFYLLFWTTLDPGPKDEIPDEGVRGTVATILFISYQVLIIVVLLNLLIAVMNATVQKVHDRKQLYWKFARTSVWSEFFDRISGIPIPFAIINVAWTIFYYSIMACLKLVKIVKARYGRQRSKTSFGIEGSPQQCDFKTEQREKRMKHAHLVLRLIDRYKAKNEVAAEDLNKVNMDNLKQDIFRHMDTIINKFNKNRH